MSIKFFFIVVRISISFQTAFGNPGPSSVNGEEPSVLAFPSICLRTRSTAWTGRVSELVEFSSSDRHTVLRSDVPSEVFY